MCVWGMYHRGSLRGFFSDSDVCCASFFVDDICFFSGGLCGKIAVVVLSMQKSGEETITRRI